MPLAIGTVLENRYRIAALLGQGGMGAVYRAWHLPLHQDVATKENTTASPASARQFEREARMMAGLRHPNLPHVIDHFVTPDGAQYLVMQYIAGQDLGQILERTGPLDQARALAYVADQHGCITQVSFQRRSCPMVAQLRDECLQRGPITHAVCTFYKCNITPYLNARDHMMDDGVHAIDTLRWMCGGEGRDDERNPGRHSCVLHRKRVLWIRIRLPGFGE